MREGVLTGIERGYFQREIREAAYEHQERVEAGEETIVGVTDYESEEDEEVDTLYVDEEAARERQLERLAEVRAERDDGEVEEALEAIREAIRGDENTIPHVIEAVKAGATMGEIMGVYEIEHGSYRETVRMA